jgi:hypothetical protein
MFRPRTLTIALALAAALFLGATHMGGCERTPEAADYANPFDPNGPLGGDGLQVRAQASDTVITVIWNHYPGRDIALYAVDHRTDLDPQWEALGDTLIDDDDVEEIYFQHKFPAPNRTHEYLVQAITVDGEFTLAGYTTPGAVTMPPVVLTDAQGLNGDKLASRYLAVKVVAGQGDSLRIADNDAFAGATVLAAAAPGDTTYATWDYGPHAAGDSLNLFVQSFGSGGYESAIRLKILEVEFAPDFVVADGVAAGSAVKVPSPVIDLEIENQGVVQMRFSPTEAGLAAAAWVPGAPIYGDFLLGPTTAVQSVWAEFEGDLGYNSVKEKKVRADLLTDATMQLDVPRNRVTTHTRVGVKSNAAALEMRFVDGPDFTGVPWVPFAVQDSVDFTGGTPGKVTIYGQYRNDWTDAAVLSDTLIFALVPLDIYFVTPPDSGLVVGGEIFEIVGRTVAADGAFITSTAVDLGDGNGFSINVGIQPEWTLNWTPPVVTADTEIVLRARATTATETSTTAIRVIVQPPGS